MTYTPVEDCDHIAVATSLDLLMTAEFNARVNCHVLPRQLSGDFDLLARDIAAFFDTGRLTVFTPSNLVQWQEPLSSLDTYQENLDNQDPCDPNVIRLKQSFAIIRADMTYLKERKRRATLRVVREYPQQIEYMPHADQSIFPWGKLIISYNNPKTLWYRNKDVESISPDTGVAVINENAKPHQFNVGDMFRFRCFSSNTDNPEENAFVHCGEQSEHPRLLLAAD